MRESVIAIRRTFAAVAILAAIALAPTAAAQISPGATRAQVINVLGWPTNTSVSGAREILSYDECTVLLVHGKVVKLEYKNADSREKMLTQPKAGESAVPGTKLPAAPATAGGATVTGPVTALPAQSSGASGATSASGAAPAATTPGGTASSAAASPPAAAGSTDPNAAKRGSPAPAAAPSSGPVPAASAAWGVFKTYALLAVIVLVVIFIGIQKWMTDRKGLGVLQNEMKVNVAEATEAARRSTPKIPDPNAPKPDPIQDGWSLALLKDMEWHRFEVVVAAYERHMGFDARLTELGVKRGVDIRIFDNNSRQLTRMVQCRGEYQKVKLSVVKAFYDLMAQERVQDGTFYATEGFVPEANDFVVGKGIDLIDGATFVARIQQLDSTAQLRLFDVAIEGDYRTPTCINCGVKMKLAGASTSRPFWSCVNFPRCKNTIRIQRIWDTPAD